MLPTQTESEIQEPEWVARDGLTPEQRRLVATERAKKFTEAEQKRYEAKKARRQVNKVQRQTQATVREWIREQSDSLVIASHYDPEPVLLALLPYLGYSKPFVIYSEFLEPLMRTFSTLQKMDSVIDLQLNETWTREHQVLPGRTHPEMNMSACSGYLLSGLKICDVVANPEALAAAATDEPKPRRAKKPKTQAAPASE